MRIPVFPPPHSPRGRGKKKLNYFDIKAAISGALFVTESCSPSSRFPLLLISSQPVTSLTPSTIRCLLGCSDRMDVSLPASGIGEIRKQSQTHRAPLLRERYPAVMNLTMHSIVASRVSVTFRNDDASLVKSSRYKLFV